jgi:uncharacterized membrane protein
MDWISDLNNLTFLSSLVVIAAVFWLVPRRSQPELFFAVTVPASFRDSEEGRDILALYYRWLAGGTTLALVGWLLIPRASFWAMFQAPLLVQLLAATSGYLIARRRAMVHAVEPTRAREAALTEVPIGLPGGWVGQLAPFLILGLVITWLALAWDSIPERIGAHWGDLSGIPNRWEDKGFWSVFSVLLVGLTMCAGMLALQWSILRHGRRSHASGIAAVHQARRFRTTCLVLLAAELLLAVIFGLLALLALVEPGPDQRLMLVALMLLSVTASPFLIVFLFARKNTGFSAQERALERAESGPPVGDRSEDRFWKWGVFYYNPDDPSLWVEKRFGIGFTFNMARPVAKAVMLFLLLLLLGSMAAPFLL